MKISTTSVSTNHLTQVRQVDNSLLTKIKAFANAPHKLNLNAGSIGSAQSYAIKDTSVGVQDKLQAIYQGFKTRRQVSVSTVTPGIIKTAIRRPPDYIHISKSHPLAQMQSVLKPGATYVRLHVLGGGQSSYVIGTKTGGGPQSPISLANQVSQGAAIINGGYFVHKDGLVSDNEETLSIGAPVGQTLNRIDSIPIPELWKGEYGQLVIDDQIVLTSGPVLSLNGEKIELPNHERMEYFLEGEENPLNRFAGALTHSSGFNERAAITTMCSSENVQDTVMHALVTSGDRSAGASMSEWQTLTNISIESLSRGGSVGRQVDNSTINLDGGGSVFLGTSGESGMSIHALGGASSESTIRPVANVIVSIPENAERKSGTP